MQNKQSLTKISGHLVKCTQAHMDAVLKKYRLSSGSYPFLLVLKGNEGINLDKLSKKLNVDKAMCSRTIQKLMELEYLKKIPDAEDSRAFKLYLTDKAQAVIPGICAEIDKWVAFITEDLTEEENSLVVDLLDKIEKKAESIRR